MLVNAKNRGKKARSEAFSKITMSKNRRKRQEVKHFQQNPCLHWNEVDLCSQRRLPCIGNIWQFGM